MSEGVSQPSGGAHATTYRCFLFADLRGYTAFVERSGNVAGAALLADYLDVTRKAVAQHHGAEIRTEGDGFYAVFPSASAAVMCGLDIVRGAEAASADRPERPIRVGVGINAGEAVQTAEGYVGSAVNLAARVCAAADSGEVLVTSTVRGIAQASLSVGFARRGRRRMKGVAEPVELFTVTTERQPEPARRPASSLLGVGAMLAATAAVIVGAIVLPPLIPGIRPPATPTPRPPSLAIGALAIGPHVADQFQPPFGLVITDPGWSVYRSGREYVGLYYESEPRGNVDIGRVEGVFENGCGAAGPVVPTGATAGSFMETLRSTTYLAVGPVSRVTVGSRSGVAADVDVSEGALAACSFGAGDVDIFPMGDETWRAQPGERFRLTAVDVDGATVVVLRSAESAAASSVAQLERFFEVADLVLDQLSF